MLEVTDSALSHLAGALDRIEAPKPENACFRIVPTDDGKLTLTVDAPAPDDMEEEKPQDPEGLVATNDKRNA